MSHDTSQGLAYLHLHKIIHADLKSLNVLLDRDKHALLADFGLSAVKQETRLKHKLQTEEAKDSLLWTAPELFNKQQPTYASDMFSLGVVLWEIATHRLPFQEFNGLPSEIATQIIHGTREKFPTDTPEAYKSLAEKCWDTNPKNRPSAEYTAQIFSQLWNKKWTTQDDFNQAISHSQDPTYLNEEYELNERTNADNYLNNAQTKFGF
jgi:serine/threonine protein kinase